jgi:hypothetical protein
VRMKRVHARRRVDADGAPPAVSVDEGVAVLPIEVFEVRRQQRRRTQAETVRLIVGQVGIDPPLDQVPRHNTILGGPRTRRKVRARSTQPRWTRIAPGSKRRSLVFANESWGPDDEGTHERDFGLDAELLAELRRGMRGEVIVPEDAGYDDAEEQASRFRETDA